VAFFFPVAVLFVATQYEIPFKLNIRFHVRVMAITPAIASHKVRHPSPSNFSVFMVPRQIGVHGPPTKSSAAVTSVRVEGLGVRDATEPNQATNARQADVVPQ